MICDKSKKPILIVSAGNTLDGIRAQSGDFPDWITEGLRYEGPILRLDAREHGIEFPALETLAGVVITGSQAMVTDRATWSEQLAAWLRICVAREKPLLGICFGHQLLAHALGGLVDYNPLGMEIGTTQIVACDHAAGDALFGGLPTVFGAQSVHAQSVCRLPPGAVTLAFNNHDSHQAFRGGPVAWGVQFHPEFSPATMQGYIRAMASRFESQTACQQALAAVAPTPEASALLARFACIAGDRSGT
ncbi:MAG TPA: glutamine amidotransferase [Porticoccaceae bacterium]